MSKKYTEYEKKLITDCATDIAKDIILKYSSGIKEFADKIDQIKPEEDPFSDFVHVTNIILYFVTSNLHERIVMAINSGKVDHERKLSDCLMLKKHAMTMLESVIDNVYRIEKISLN